MVASVLPIINLPMELGKFTNSCQWFTIGSYWQWYAGCLMLKLNVLPLSLVIAEQNCQKIILVGILKKVQWWKLFLWFTCSDWNYSLGQLSADVTGTRQPSVENEIKKRVMGATLWTALPIQLRKNGCF